MDTLNLFDELLARGRRLQEMGRQRDARTSLTQLARMRELPAHVAEETQARLGELALKGRRPERARRHLAVALQYRPDSARYHFLMATSLQMDESSDLARSLAHYQRALELDPGHVRCRCDAGLLLLRLGRIEEGLAWLRQAVQEAPERPEVLAKLVRGLNLAGRSDEARRALQSALFRNGRDLRFRKVWYDFQFQDLRRRREAGQLAQGDQNGPVLLPFVRAQRSPSEGAIPTVVRCDEAEPLPAPHPARDPSGTRHWPGQRHVQ
jgi:tetratricopeptide (TPR) repeat protein